jgi:DnaJ-class molecular chaperone
MEQADNLKPADEVSAEETPSGPNLCPECDGKGRIDGSRCEACRGTGVVEEGVGGG